MSFHLIFISGVHMWPVLCDICCSTYQPSGTVDSLLYTGANHDHIQIHSQPEFAQNIISHLFGKLFTSVEFSNVAGGISTNALSHRMKALL